MGTEEGVEPPELGHRDDAPAAYGFLTDGIRFYWRGGLDGEDRQHQGPSPERAELVGDGEMLEAARVAAAGVGSLVGGQARWRSIATGGAEGHGIVELVVVVRGALGLLMDVVKSPEAAKRAWETIRPLFERMRSEKIADWNAGSEAAILKCLSVVQEDWPGAFTDPAVVRVIEDGRSVPPYGDVPVGVRVVVIPDLRHKKTHIFAIDERLEIHGSIRLDRLTADASEYGG